MPQLSLHSPLGAISLAEEDGALVALDWGWGRDQDETALLRMAREQMHAYFDGALTSFTLPLTPGGTAYQQRVWGALADIPYGRTETYGRLAMACGGSPRSVGQANRHNPLPILIPCHRVVGAAGAGGYSGGAGVETKDLLLRLERRPASVVREKAA